MKGFDLGALLTNPSFIAGAQGMFPSLGNSLSQGALEQRQQQQHQMQQQQFQMQQQEALRAQERAQLLARLIQEGVLDPSDLNGSMQNLIARGVKPEAAMPLIGQLATIQNQLASQGVAQENLGLNKERLNLDRQRVALAQQKFNDKKNGTSNQRKLTTSEIRLNKANLDKLNSTAKASAEQLKQLDTLEKVYQTFDKEAQGSIGSGSFVSSLLPKGGNEDGILNSAQQLGENTIYSDKARAALQTIKKVNSLLLQQRIEAKKGGGPVTDVLKKEIKEGLPRPEILPEARNENIKSLRSEAFKNILEQQFFTEWSKLNGRDTDGAGAAFQKLVSAIPIVDENGQPNKELLKDIPKLVREFLESHWKRRRRARRKPRIRAV